MYKILADDNLSELSYYFSEFGQVITKPGRSICATDLYGIDALLIRSVTTINADLFRLSKPKFIGSATIGTDHINYDDLDLNCITVAHAPGCNASAVLGYVLAALFYLSEHLNFSLSVKTIGIVGCGYVGSLLRSFLQTLGLKVVVFDPLLENQSGLAGSLQELATADIITLHVPLTKNVIHPTYKMIDYSFLCKLKSGATIINTSRGSVIDTSALKDIKQSKTLHCIFDVWPKEPYLDKELLDQCIIATPHIAGYSLEGKIRGTHFIYKAWLKYLADKGQIAEEKPLIQFPEQQQLTVYSSDDIYSILHEILSKVVDLESCSQRLKALPDENGIVNFDSLRKAYVLRRELSAYRISLAGNTDEKVVNMLRDLGFYVVLL